MENTPEQRPADLSDMDRLYARFGLESPHPPYETLQRLVDKEDMGVRERGRLEQHLDACARCREDIRQLEKLREEPLLELSTATVRAPLVIAAGRPLWRHPATLALAGNLAAIGVIWLVVGQRNDARLGAIRKDADARVLTAKASAQSAIEDAARVKAEAEATRAGAREQIAAVTARATADAQKAKEAAARAVRERDDLRKSFSSQVARAGEMARTDAKAEAAEAIRREQAARRDAELGRRVALAKAADAQKQVATLTAGERRESSLLKDGRLPDYAPIVGVTKGPNDPTNPLTGGAAAAVDGEFGPVFPVRTASLSRTPTLRWNPKPGARGYRIVIADGERSLRTIQLPADATEWTVEAGLLRRGGSYTWSVTPSGEPPRLGASFLVASVADAKRFADDSLRLALKQARGGFYEQARRTLRSLLEDVPELTEAETARKLLASLETPSPDIRPR